MIREANGFTATIRQTRIAQIRSSVSTREFVKPLNVRCGHVVVTTSKARRSTKAIALARKDTTPIKTAGNASRNANALNIGEDGKLVTPAKDIMPEIRRAGNQSKSMLNNARVTAARFEGVRLIPAV